MSSEQTQEPPQIHFLVPGKTVFEDFAALVCRTLAQQIDSEFSNPEVVDGFSKFLQITSQVTSETLTKAVNDEFRSLYEDSQKLSGDNAGQKTVFKPIRWSLTSTKRAMAWPRPSRRRVTVREVEAENYDMTA